MAILDLKGDVVKHVIGTDVQAWDAQLDDLAALTVTKGNLIAADGANWQAIAVGTDAQVLVADSSEATGLKWAATSVSYAQVVTVAKSGGDYATIQGAIDAITDATTSKRYAVKVQPGNYAEAVTMKDYVDIIGSGRTNSRITGTSGTVLTFPANKGTILDMGIYVDYGALGADSQAIVSAGADSVMIRCDIGVTKSSGDFKMNALYISAGSFRMSDSYFTYSITGATTDTALVQSAVVQTGVLTTVLLNNNEMTITSDDTNDYLVGFETTANVTGTALLANNVIAIEGASVGACSGLWLYGTGSGMIANQNRLTVNCDALAYGIFIDSAAGGATIDTRHNEIIITSAGTAQSASVAVGDTWNSTFDKITAANGYSGAGTITFTSSAADGEMTVSGVVTAPLEVYGSSTTALLVGKAGQTNVFEVDTDNALIRTSDDSGTDYLSMYQDSTAAVFASTERNFQFQSEKTTTNATFKFQPALASTSKGAILELYRTLSGGSMVLAGQWLQQNTFAGNPGMGFQTTDTNTQPIEFRAFNGSVGYIAFSTDGGERARVSADGDFLIGTTTATNRFSVTRSSGSALKAIITNVVKVELDNTATPEIGFGPGVLFQAKSSTTSTQDVGRLTYIWTDATHATRKARGTLTAYDTAERDCIQWEASGAAPMVGFLGTAPVVQQTGCAIPTDLATCITAITALRAALNAYGLTTVV